MITYSQLSALLPNQLAMLDEMHRALVHGIVCFMAKPVFIALKNKKNKKLRQNLMWWNERIVESLSALSQSLWILLEWAVTVGKVWPASTSWTSKVARSPRTPAMPLSRSNHSKTVSMRRNSHSTTRSHLSFFFSSHPAATHREVLALFPQWILSPPLLHVPWPPFCGPPEGQPSLCSHIWTEQGHD